MDAATRRLVRQRAGNRCEYCGLSQDAAPVATFHIEHIVPKKHGGSDESSNLALACYHCNLHKGPNLTGIDPLAQAVVSLFDPRRQAWDDHFEHIGVLLAGKTPISPRHVGNVRNGQ